MSDHPLQTEQLSDLHIGEFYADAAKILINLFRIFPRPITLYAEDICGPDTPDEYGVHSPRYQACFATMLWLGDEGYIRFQDTIKADAIDQAVLTGPCFTALLTPVPEAESERTTVVFQLNQALASQSSAEIAQSFKILLHKMS